MNADAWTVLRWTLLLMVTLWATAASCTGSSKPPGAPTPEHRPDAAPAGEPLLASPPDLAALAGPATSCSGEPATWVERALERDRIRYAAGLEADAHRAEAGVLAVRAALAEVVGVPSDATPPTLIWLVTASPQIRTGVALTYSDSSSATVFLYSPSCDSDPRPRQFERTIAQELSGEYLQAATRLSPAGWSFYSAPSWFVQGAEEWVARQVHEQPADLGALAIERALVPPDGAIGMDGSAMTVQNVYRDGEALIAWLTLTRGPDVLQRLLRSDAPTFEAALMEVIGLDVAALGAGYLEWRSAHRGSSGP